MNYKKHNVSSKHTDQMKEEREAISPWEGQAVKTVR